MANSISYTFETARTIAREEKRIRLIAVRYVRNECISDDLLVELAQAILADDGDEVGTDAWVAEWFSKRVAREPRLAKSWRVS